jgi:ATP-binding protein involved in chromosome partitioning
MLQRRADQTMPMPLEIIGLGKPTVRFVWSETADGADDLADDWSARDLRLRCTCAYCQSEATGERLLDPATVPMDLTVTNMALVGNYGVGIHFSDGHTTGIYRFRELLAQRHPDAKL